jgi:hypothetical protein
MLTAKPRTGLCFYTNFRTRPLCGYEKRFEERQSRFTSERESVLGRCEGALESAVYKFVKKYLPKRHPLGLDSVL